VGVKKEMLIVGVGVSRVSDECCIHVVAVGGNHALLMVLC